MPSQEPENTASATASIRKRPASSFLFSNARLATLLGALVIVLAALCVYKPAWHGEFLWDDDDMLTENSAVKEPLHEIWFSNKAPFLSTKFYDYIPLTLTSFWIEWRQFEMHSTGYHIDNILLHALTAILFWRILKRLKVPGAWVAALVFSIHPVNAQSVAWITERKNTLSLFFYALSLLCFLKSTPVEDNQRPSKPYYIASLLLFLLALLAKAAVIMLPVVLLGMLWWQCRRISWAQLKRTVPFFALSGLFAAVTIWFQYNRSISTDVVHSAGTASRLATAGCAVWFYLGKIFAPTNLSFIYTRWNMEQPSVLLLLPGLAVIACLGLFWRFRASWGAPLLLAFGYFVVSLFPVLGFFNIYFQKYTLVADYWQYPAVIGIIGLVVGAGAVLNRKIPGAAYAAIPIIAGLGYLTFQQSVIYQNDEILFRDVVAKNPTSWMAHNTLGVDLLQHGKVEEALIHFRKTVEIKPDHAMAHCNIGNVMMGQGKLDTAMEEYRLAVRYDTNLVEALRPLAWIYACHPSGQIRNGPEALRLAEMAVNATDGSNPIMLDTLAAALAENSQYDKAVAVEQHALEIVRSGGANDLVNEMAGHLREYQAGRPHRE